MLKFMVKCALLFILLFFGVLLGMQQANVGMLEMKGYDDVSFKGAFDIYKNETGEVEASLLGEQVTSHNLKEKQKKLEEVKAFNFFSALGGKLADLLTTIFQVTIQFIIHTIDRILTMMGS